MSGGIADVLDGKSMCICAGSGGVGKTTTSAAIAVGMAARGRKVAVLTIDPARRLADSLGLDELGNEPRRVDRTVRRSERDRRALGDDARREGDLRRAGRRHAPDAEARDRVLDNRIYQQISGALAGSQEYMAMEKLYELHTEGRYDLLVLDTPPTRNALDFLDAPQRADPVHRGQGACGCSCRPTGFGARVAGRGFGVVASVLRRVTGGDLIADLSEFFSALAGLLGGFRDRAKRVEGLLRDPETTFLVVTGPAGEPIEEAGYLRAKLEEGDLALGGLIVNRVHPLTGPDEAPGDSEGALEALSRRRGGVGDADLAARIVSAAANRRTLAARDRRNIDELAARADGVPLFEVPELSDEIHDIEGLTALGRHLFGE